MPQYYRVLGVEGDPDSVAAEERADFLSKLDSLRSDEWSVRDLERQLTGLRTEWPSAELRCLVEHEEGHRALFVVRDGAVREDYPAERPADRPEVAVYPYAEAPDIAANYWPELPYRGDPERVDAALRLATDERVVEEDRLTVPRRFRSEAALRVCMEEASQVVSLREPVRFVVQVGVRNFLVMLGQRQWSVVALRTMATDPADQPLLDGWIGAGGSGVRGSEESTQDFRGELDDELKVAPGAAPHRGTRKDVADPVTVAIEAVWSPENRSAPLAREALWETIGESTTPAARDCLLRGIREETDAVYFTVRYVVGRHEQLMASLSLDLLAAWRAEPRPQPFVDRALELLDGRQEDDFDAAFLLEAPADLLERLDLRNTAADVERLGAAYGDRLGSLLDSLEKDAGAIDEVQRARDECERAMGDLPWDKRPSLAEPALATHGGRLRRLARDAPTDAIRLCALEVLEGLGEDGRALVDLTSGLEQVGPLRSLRYPDRPAKIEGDVAFSVPDARPLFLPEMNRFLSMSGPALVLHGPEGEIDSVPMLSGGLCVEPVVIPMSEGAGDDASVQVVCVAGDWDGPRLAWVTVSPNAVRVDRDVLVPSEPRSVVAAAGVVACQTFDKLFAYREGELIWKKKVHPERIHGGARALYYWDGGKLVGLDVESGQQRLVSHGMGTEPPLCVREGPDALYVLVANRLHRVDSENGAQIEVIELPFVGRGLFSDGVAMHVWDGHGRLAFHHDDLRVERHDALLSGYRFDTSEGRGERVLTPHLGCRTIRKLGSLEIDCSKADILIRRDREILTRYRVPNLVAVGPVLGDVLPVLDSEERLTGRHTWHLLRLPAGPVSSEAEHAGTGRPGTVMERVGRFLRRSFGGA